MAQVPVSRLEISLNRLLKRCETMVAEKPDDWRCEAYVKTLEEMLNNLRNQSACQPSLDVMNSYEKKIHFLRSVVTAEKIQSCVDRSLAYQMMNRYPNDTEEARNLQIKTTAKGFSEARKELMGDVSGGVQIRRRPQASSTDVDAALRDQYDAQERIAQDMVQLAQNLKATALTARDIIIKDKETVNRNLTSTETNLGQLTTESHRLEKHIKFSCNCWIWIMLGVVWLVFLFMITFIRLFPKRY